MIAAPDLERIARQYPEAAVRYRRADIPRTLFHVSLLAGRVPPGGRVLDVGGGFGLTSFALRAEGYAVTVADDFNSFRHPDAAALRVLQTAHGIETLCKDVVREPLDLTPASLDAVFCVASMEHWHASPRHLFAELMAALKPGGVFVLGAPNCVNLRKRLTVPFGYGKWSTMASWYETEQFRGHVREPDVDDLRYIARDIGLANPRILGSNYMGYISRFQWVRHLIPLGDRVLRLRPSLCSEIYVRGEKAAAG